MKFTSFLSLILGTHYPSLPDPRPVILRKKVTWEGFEAYLHSFSALHTFHERYPDDLKREDGTITQRFLRNLKVEMQKIDDTSTGSGGISKDEANDLEIEWPMALVLVKRK